MKKKPKVGIIGFGYVGAAIAWGFELHADIRIYDKYIEEFKDTLEKTVNESDFLFVAVPTPLGENGEQDQTIVHDVINDIDEVAKKSRIIIIKSTIVPGTSRVLSKEFPRHHFVHSPEFLTERVSRLTFINSARIILGGDDPTLLGKCEQLFRRRFTTTPIYRTTWEAAELVKYMCNNFFTLKIAFLNEFYSIAEQLNISYEELRTLFLSDQRVGNSHMDVPGYDGKRGYGGTCFPKDTKAMIHWADSIGYSLETMKAAEKVNKLVRDK